MNENLDLTKILEGCPEGTEFYNTVYGIVKFICIDLSNENNPIKVRTTDNYYFTFSLTKDGKLNHYHYGECTLFPSKEQRDWSEFVRFWGDEANKENLKGNKFDPNTLKPFDKILVRKADSIWSIGPWTCEYFSYRHPNTPTLVNGVSGRYEYCIPFNDETEHLLGTTDDCPEYYKWWKK